MKVDKFDIDYFQEYVATYTERHHDRPNIMFLDMLYGIGISIDEKYKGAEGFKRFKEDIRWLDGLTSEEFVRRLKDKGLLSEEPSPWLGEAKKRQTRK